MADKKNISSKKMPSEKDALKAYLKDNLSKDWLNASGDDIPDDDFMKDAIEGLDSFSSTDKIHHSVRQLNKKLHQSTRSKRKSRSFEFKEIFWFVLAVVIIILLVLVAYEVIDLSK